MQRKGGIIFVKVDGVQLQAKGEFTYSLMTEKRESIIGADGVHGYKATPVAPYIEGEITDSSELDVANLLKINNATVTLELANGKVVVLRNGVYTGDGTTGTEEGNIQVRFEGLSAQEIK